MLEPLSKWICDTCGEIINAPGEGYVQWETDENLKRHNFIIVHHLEYSPYKDRGKDEKGCYQDVAGHDLSLDRLAGNIVKILEWLDRGKIFEPEYAGIEVRDIREYVEFLRRLLIPYYEEARLYIDKAIDDGFFEGMGSEKIYQEEVLKEVIRKYS